MNLTKTLLVAALGTLSFSALAESQVTLYGTVGASVVVNKNKGEDTTVSLTDGVAGGSVWGIEGEEELGNGYSVGFSLENSFTLNNGAEGEEGLAWAKQALINVKGGFGEFAFGRMGGLASYEGSYTIWDASPFGTDYLQAGLGNVFVTGQINNNSLVYVTPEFAGAHLYIQYSNGTEDDTNKWALNNHYYGVGLTYEIGGLNLVGIIERFDNKADEAKPTMVYSLSAAYDFEVAKVYFGYQYADRFHTMDQSEDLFVGGKGMNQNAFTLGTEIPAAGGTFKLAVNYGFGKIKSMDSISYEDVDSSAVKDDKFNRLSLGAAYEYPLSKRTFAYVWGAWQRGGKALRQQEVRGDFENFSLGFGLNHNF